MATDGRRSGAFGFASLAVLALGCQSAPPPPPPAPPPVKASNLEQYLPLEDGTVYSYRTLAEPSGERGLLVLEIRRPRRELAELVVAGRVRRLNIAPGAVSHVTGGFLLREPLSVGASFRGDFGQVKVTDVARAVAVPAGTFAGCVETVEEATTTEGTKRTTTAFCPGVGIALRVTEAEEAAGQGSERMELQSFGRRFDPGALE